LKVNDHSQSGDYEQKNISKELKPFYPSRLMGLGVEFTLSVFADFFSSREPQSVFCTPKLFPFGALEGNR